MIARAPKESAVDTIRYEVKMLRFCLERLVAGGHEDLLRFVLLEAFLLHYRNLIRFFSGLHHRPDDLSTHQPEEWAARSLDPEELASTQAAATILDEKYYILISKYLQHCTKLRHKVPQAWDVTTMALEIEPVLVQFDRFTAHL